MRATVPLGISRAVTEESRRNDRMAAIEVIGESTATILHHHGRQL
jgi:hypothetical protein